MKKLCAALLCWPCAWGPCLPRPRLGPEVNARAALLMEKSTGQVLYQANAHAPLEPASVTKVMTLLLIMEALEEGTITKDTMVPVSATAAGWGAPRCTWRRGEEFSVHDLLKAIAVASGNDACVAMAEYLAGSEGGLRGADEPAGPAAGHERTRSFATAPACRPRVTSPRPMTSP